MTPTSTATLGPGSYPNGTTLRTTAQGQSPTWSDHVRYATGGRHERRLGDRNRPLDYGRRPHLGAGASAPGLGSGWMAATTWLRFRPPSQSRTPATATATQTPGGTIPSRTPTRPAGGFIAGDTVRTTTRVNLRSGPTTASTVLPKSLQKSLGRGEVDLNDPATTLALLQLNAVIGVKGSFDGQKRLTAVGINCALCHSVVDNSFAPESDTGLMAGQIET